MLDSDARTFVSSSAPRNGVPAPLSVEEITRRWYPAPVEEPTTPIVYTPAPTGWWL